MIKHLLKQVANQFGYDIQHLPTDPIARQQLDLLRKHNINLIFDVGANVGQYAQKMRTLGYKGRIVSFEPQPDAFQLLRQKAAVDSNWQAVETALGNFDGETTINVSQNSYSSSILDILPAHLESAPDASYIDRVPVKVQKLDSILAQYFDLDSHLFVKIDTQGFERQVFEGALHSLSKIKGFQMELSLLPLYEGEMLMQEMIDLLRNYGYCLQLIESGYRHHKTSEIIQLECYFLKF